MNWPNIVNKLFDELNDLKQTLKNDKIYNYALLVDGLRFSYRICSDNLIEFKEWATENNLPSITFPSTIDSRKQVNKFLIKLARLFTNYLSSAIAYADHSLTVKNKICKEHLNFSKKYRDTVGSPVDENDVYRFMKDMRIYSTHYGVIKFILNTNLNPSDAPNERKRYITLDTDNLKQWDGWKSKSKEYISSISKTTSIYTTLEEFDNILKIAYESFSKSFTEFFKKEVNNYRTIVQRINRIQLLLEKLTTHNRNQKTSIIYKSELD